MFSDVFAPPFTQFLRYFCIHFLFVLLIGFLFARFGRSLVLSNILFIATINSHQSKKNNSSGRCSRRYCGM